MVGGGQVLVENGQPVFVQRDLHGVEVRVEGRDVVAVVTLQIVPDARMRVPVAAGADGHGLARGDEQIAHIDVAVRNIGHRYESVAAGVDGGIALVVRHGVDAQGGHRAFCWGGTVGFGGGFVVSLRKDIRPAEVGGKALHIPQKSVPAGQVGDHLVLFGGRLGGDGFLCKSRQAQADGQRQRGAQGAEYFLHGCPPFRIHFSSG